MANPIRTSDIYQDTGELKRLIDELEQAQKHIEALRKSAVQDAVKIEASLKDVSGASADQRQEIERAANAADEIQKRYQKYSESLEDTAVEIAALKNAQRELNNVNKLTAKLNASAEGSYNRLSAQYSLNKIRLNQMSKAQRESTEEGRALVKQSAELYEEMKRLQEETGKHTLNVGNYRDALKDIPGPLGQFQNGLDEVGDSMKLLLRNPIMLFLTAIVGALAALGSAFARSEKGAQLMAKASGILNGLMSELVDISVKAVDVIIAAFNDPVGAIKDLGKFILDNILNRFRAIPLLAKAGADAIQALAKGDFAALKEAGTDAMFAIQQAVTGLTENQLKELGNGLKDLVAQAMETSFAFAIMEANKREVIKANRELAKAVEALTTQEELYRVVADDTTRSFKEREEAAENARKSLEARAAKEIQIARNNLKVINDQISARRANQENVEALLDQQLSAYQQLAQAEREYTVAVADNERTRAELRQDRLERDLDILIDGFDNQKTINERIIADEARTLSERARLYGETLDLAERTFAKQIETIQQFTGVAVDANELLATSDAVTLNERIRSLGLSEIIEGRLLEIIRERRLAVQDLSEVEAELIAIRRAAATAPDLLSDRITQGIAAEAEAELKEVQAIAKRITKPPTEADAPENIYGLLGLNLEDSEQQAIADATAFAIDQVNQLAQAKVEASNRAVEASEREVQAAQENLNATIALAEQGYAVNVQQAQNELQLARDRQRQALEQQREAERQQRQLETIQQAGSLVTAAAKIFATVPFPASLAAVGTMFGSFALAKVRAAKLTREFGAGDYTVLQGPRHSGKGTGIPLGVAPDGVAEYAEGGEGRAIFSRLAVAKYGSRIADVVRQFNDLSFGEDTTSLAGATVRNIMSQDTSLDTGRMEGYLAQISQHGQQRTYRDSRGRLVIQRGNITTVYN
jgi:hypothetical protein